jgi:outer membrane protein TolC
MPLVIVVQAILLTSQLALAENSLNLDAYLTQVRRGHQGYQGASTSSEGALQRSTESETLTAFRLFADAQYVFDESPKIQVLQGTKDEVSSYDLGVQKVTSFGLSGKLYYNLTRTLISGLTPIPLPGFTIPSDYYDASPMIELRYSLLRNGGGREVQAAVEAMQAQALSQSHSDRFQTQIIESQAEVAYWRLALARDAIDVQVSSVERSQKILDWNSRRVRMRLADESDLLQAQSGLKLRQLELQQVVDDERVAAQYFNSLRGTDKPRVDEDLTSLDDVEVEDLAPPPRAARRQDVEAAYEGQRAAQANARMSAEKNLPDLQIYTTLGLTGRDDTGPNAVADSFHTTNPIFALGATFSIPLDLSVLWDARRGWEKEAQGAELKFKRKLFEQDNDWVDFTRKYDEAKRRLGLARAIETVQMDKFKHEKERQTLGRSTTFLVLQFEQDLASSQFTRLRAQAELLMLIAQMKIFSPVSQPVQGNQS